MKNLFSAMSKGTAVLAAVFGAFFLLWSFCITTIDVGERAVVLRWGNYVGTLEEGLNFTLPIDRIIRFNVRDMHYDSTYEVSSKDMQTITIKTTLIFALDPEQLGDVYKNYGTKYGNVVIVPVLSEIVNAVTAQYPIEEFVEKRAELSNKILGAMIEKTRGTGIIVKKFYVTEHDFSDEYNRAIEQKKVAEQEALKARFVKEKSILESEAQAIKTKTLSPLVLLEQAIGKWDGVLPRYLSAGELPMLFNMKDLESQK